MQFICKPGSVVKNHLSSPSVTQWIKRFYRSAERATITDLPCSRQGLPLHHVTVAYCELLPQLVSPLPI